MKVPFFILGFLLRSGPLYGYELKKRIEEEASDFSQIKLSNLYYHLRFMNEKGWLEAQKEETGKRPAREVYSITQAGVTAFHKLAKEYLISVVRFDFPLDGALFFSGNIKPETFITGLDISQKAISESLARIKAHRAETLSHVPEHYRPIAELIFSHHEIHFDAEQKWLNQVSLVLSQIGTSMTSEKGGENGKA